MVERREVYDFDINFEDFLESEQIDSINNELSKIGLSWFEVMDDYVMDDGISIKFLDVCFNGVREIEKDNILIKLNPFSIAKCLYEIDISRINKGKIFPEYNPIHWRYYTYTLKAIDIYSKLKTQSNKFGDTICVDKALFI